MLDTQMLLEKYDRPVPRYTSFPTAVQFDDGVTHDDAVAGLSSLAPGEQVSVYIHIPFCHSLCHYCGCHTKIVNTYSPIAAYIENLLEEIELAGRVVAPGIQVGHVHFGGGSPNYAKPSDIQRILDALSGVFTFSGGTQIDMECDPRLMTRRKISDYARMGVTRMSLGIQDFDPDVQKAINRVQPYEHVAQCVDWLAAAGIDRLNFDLIIGLPKQTPETVARTLERAVGLSPGRFAVFPYAHVPWMKKHQKLLERFPMPDRNVRFDMTMQVHETLVGNGYESIGIDHYAREDDMLHLAQQSGAMRRNFQGYTDDPSRTIIGFGMSAISQYETLYIQNTTDAPAYRKSLGRRELPVARGCRLTEDDVVRRALIEKLMCDFEIRFEEFPGVPVPQAELMELQEDGLVMLEPETLSITGRGKPFVRIAAACFDPYFEQKGARHAKSV